MKEGKKASFSFDGYKINQLSFDFDLHKEKNDIKLNFDISGKFSNSTKVFEIVLDFIAYDDGCKLEEHFVNARLKCFFGFEGVETVEDVPTYFYRNSIAIIFPYLRAFLSSISVQANNGAIILPTMNLASLETPLRDSTITVD